MHHEDGNSISGLISGCERSFHLLLAAESACGSFQGWVTDRTENLDAGIVQAKRSHNGTVLGVPAIDVMILFFMCSQDD